MSSCTTCGHPRGAGRFCPHCGSAADAAPNPGSGDWRTDTAERKVPPAPADPRTPPSAVAPPPPPRYPLYADEVAARTPTGSLVTHLGEPEVEPEPQVEQPIWSYAEPLVEEDEPYDDPAYEDRVYDDDRRSPWLWMLLALLFVALVAGAWWFLVRQPGSEGATGRDDALPAASSEADQGVDVAERASVTAPRTAPPNQDVNGERTSYDASNMLDGRPETTWRAGGDTTGMALKITLREPTELTQVGLVNGYAKTSADDQGRTYDWYLGNRRVTEVVWVFPGGQTVRQTLTDDRDLQVIDVEPVTTSKVVLRIAKVSPPGDGTASRDFTAISELSLIAAG